MSLIELPTPEAATAHAQASTSPAAAKRTVVRNPQRPPPREATTRPVPHAIVPPSPREPTTPAPRESSPETAPAPAPQRETTNTAQAANASTTPAAGAGSSGAGNAPAHLLSQPLPELPDDLRDAAYRATAIARFTVHADGTADVELIHPTPMPRLNQILLDALHRWRFAPATQNGRPVESRQDVRVHFNVN